MKTRRSLVKVTLVALVLATSVVALATPGQARGSASHGAPGHAGQNHHGFANRPRFAGHVGQHSHGHVVIGVGPSFFWGPGYPYDYPDAMYPGPEPPPANWYYCPSAGAYYPYVPS